MNGALAPVELAIASANNCAAAALAPGCGCTVIASDCGKAAVIAQFNTLLLLVEAMQPDADTTLNRFGKVIATVSGRVTVVAPVWVTATV